ncbi:MAG: hypothetical protein HFF36_09655 [Coprobacillus sp.]|nr:hypothetical protein [Coprobacillus sp.]
MIKIDEEFYIDSDERQYILQQKKFNNQKQEYYYSPIAYLSGIKECVENVMKIKQRRLCKKDLNLAGALREIKILNIEMKELLDKIEENEKL